MTDPRALKRAQHQARTLKLIVGAEVYRSDDKGESWRKANTDDIANLDHIPFNYGFYFGQIRVAPDRENEIFILGAPLFLSTDGGKTYETVSTPHSMPTTMRCGSTRTGRTISSRGTTEG